jgi:glycerol kinase
MYIVVIDQGTSSTRAIIFNVLGQIVCSSAYPITQYYPQPGWVEHCPEEIWRLTLQALRDVCQQVDIQQIIACGITNQRETTVVWDKYSGNTLHRAIVWQDRRTQDFCDTFKELESTIFDKTGLKCDPYFSASKINWLLKHLSTNAQGVAIGTIDSFLLWRLTGGKVHRTDVTNASRTMLFNIHQQCWDQELLRAFDIPDCILPEVCDSDFHFGDFAFDIVGKEIPIYAILGDQQAALLGVGCIHPGNTKVTYGTGGFVMQNTGKIAHHSTSGLLTTVAYRVQRQTDFALEGNIYDAGSTLHWLRDDLKLFEKYTEASLMANSVDDNNGVYFIPAFSGLGAPHWINRTGASFVGMSRATNKSHLVRAVLESVVYQTMDILHALNQDTKLPITHLIIDGGMAMNEWLTQFLANICQIEINIPDTFENTAKGVAMLAMVSAHNDYQLTTTATNWQNFHTISPIPISRQPYYDWLEHLEKFKT